LKITGPGLSIYKKILETIISIMAKGSATIHNMQSIALLALGLHITAY